MMTGMLFLRATTFLPSSSRRLRFLFLQGNNNSGGCRQQQRIRQFSVKALSWCEPGNKSAQTRESLINKNSERKSMIEKSHTKTNNPIDKFGIVVAMSKNRVIGKDGSIPWPRLAEDRNLFKTLTQDRILVIGRKTLEEQPNLRHVDHAKYCIVISTSMDETDLPRSENDSPSLLIARSFPEALDISRQISEEGSPNGSFPMVDDDNDDNSLICWIAGGTKIYEEALKHPNLYEVHLSVVDLDVYFDNQDTVAVFPAKYRWDHKFEMPSCAKYPPEDDDLPGFEYFIYSRK